MRRERFSIDAVSSGLLPPSKVVSHCVVDQHWSGCCSADHPGRLELYTVQTSRYHLERARVLYTKSDKVSRHWIHQCFYRYGYLGTPASHGMVTANVTQAKGCDLRRIWSWFDVRTSNSIILETSTNIDTAASLSVLPVLSRYQVLISSKVSRPSMRRI